MTVTDHAARVLFDYLLPEDLEDQILDTFPAVVISHQSESTTVSLVVSAETALQLLDETVREVRTLCAVVGNDGTMVELTQLED